MNPRSPSRRGAVSRAGPRPASGIAARPRTGLLRRVGRVTLYGAVAFLIGSIVLIALYRALPPPGTPLIDAGELIPKGTVAARRAIAALRRGTHLTLLADQKMNDGIPVPFFGRPAMTAPALAVLALRFDCDVLPARVERLDGARFRLTVFPPLSLPRSGEPHADAAALMARVNAILEAWIRDRPEQWLWLHQRWPD